MLLDSATRARLERLSLHSRQRVRGMWSGRHTSVSYGDSMDFADYRQYTPGDDIRRIDQALWARLGVVLVRLFEAEDELPVRLLVDRSLSMRFGAKLDVAKQLAAMISYLALSAGDRLYPYATPGEGQAPFVTAPAARHAGAWPRVERWLEDIECVGAADLARTARDIAGPRAVRGPLVIISDLMTEDWQSALAGISLAGGGLVLHVLAPEELDPDLAGDLKLIDVEDGRSADVSTSSEAMRQYQTTLTEYLEGVSSAAHRGGLDYVLVPAVPDALPAVLKTLASRSVVR